MNSTATNHGDFDVVTGALSFTGRHIAQRLIDDGRGVRTLTAHPDADPSFATKLDVVPYRWDDPVALADSLRGAGTLYNTFWVRFSHGRVSFEEAISKSSALFVAAERAGVDKIVHVSITNPSLSSPLPYFCGKAMVEQALASCGVPFTIVRPTVVLRPGDVLVNNIAWLLRHLPLFGVAGRGDYGVRPVHVEDVARLCVEAARSGRECEVIDAVGPETYTFVEIVELIRTAVGSRSRIVSLPTPIVPLVSRALGLLVHDVLLTGDELRGLMDGLVTTDGPATGRIALSEWLADSADGLGEVYASELARHFEQAPTKAPAGPDVAHGAELAGTT